MCSHHPHSHDHDAASRLDRSPDEPGALVASEPPRQGLAARLGIGLVRGYQRYISPYKPPVCRFYPSCSQYTLTAIQRYGLIKGSWLGLWRILRCHPFHPGGIDHVP